MNCDTPTTRVVIACGGTGGHLYPGMAVAERLYERGAAVTLAISEKEVDQRAVRDDARFEILTLPAVGFSAGRFIPFAVRVWRSIRQCLDAFREQTPAVVLSMGGFTSAAPVLGARRLGLPVVLHEANAIPGRANRWLARVATRCYVVFPEANQRLSHRDVRVVGMPVRPAFQPADAGSCRLALGLRPDRPVLLVMGGSQGAHAINTAMVGAAPRILEVHSDLQILHLTGAADEPKVRGAYAEAGVPAKVRAFLTEMELALGAADAVVSRSGASSLAEFAAMGVPPILIPYPHAADDHQAANARSVEAAGGAVVLRQEEATAGRLAGHVHQLLGDPARREGLRRGLAGWHRPGADDVLAEDILGLARRSEPPTSTAPIAGRGTRLATLA
ncbi:MAG: undecaprenyldiphospho-muramoylpentapeptide beta-N-acetylglucosaminyltransferase [Verrucomicrobiales bacterium]|nr:undecaprenyldiphospho-muramoylpentapeptide beta-N-acetylglucosaminyltransferase [Verrucomicrobiales bacterium]